MYPSANNSRGLELSNPQDYVTVSSDLKTLSIHFNTHNNVDQVRILTATATPEPSTMIIAACGAILLTAASKMRAKRLV